MERKKKGRENRKNAQHPHRRDEAWSASLWQTFFAMTMGAQIPVIAEKPLAACGCRKFQLDAMGDHLCTCTAHSVAKKAHDWAVEQLADLFRTTNKFKTQHVTKCRGRHCGDIKPFCGLWLYALEQFAESTQRWTFIPTSSRWRSTPKRLRRNRTRRNKRTGSVIRFFISAVLCKQAPHSCCLIQCCPYYKMRSFRPPRTALALTWPCY